MRPAGGTLLEVKVLRGPDTGNRELHGKRGPGAWASEGSRGHSAGAAVGPNVPGLQRGQTRLRIAPASWQGQQRIRKQMRRRLRYPLWRQWKRPVYRERKLRVLGLDDDRVWRSAVNGRGPWWNAGAPHLTAGLPTAFVTHM